MGDLKCGFEEVDGVRLGYLLIKGKQMFALSQVFNDLLKNIPRTTLHKRMDHLKVKKHQCDLGELRTLKAIHSVAFHAAKCTLISREDVEALNISCKTQRVLKSKRKEAPGRLPVKPAASFCKQERFWLGLNEPAESLPTKSEACERRDRSLRPPVSLLPLFVSKYSETIYPEVSRAPPEAHLNYEHAVIPSSYVALQPNPSFLRSVACSRRPSSYKVAVARQPRLCRPADYKRRRTREDRGGFWGANYTKRLLLLPPKGARALKVTPVCPLGTVPGTYSSDSDSSCGNDSDMGSSMSGSSNSASSEEEEWEASRSESSDVNSEDDSSSASDSSSSQVSVGSIRFRRTTFCSPACKPPLMAKANFLYHFASSPAALGASRVQETPSDRCEIKSECRNECWERRPPLCCPRTGRCVSVGKDGPLSCRTCPHAPVPYPFKGTDFAVKRDTGRDPAPHPKTNMFTQQNIPSEAKPCIPASTSRSEESKTGVARCIKKVSPSSTPLRKPKSSWKLPPVHAQIKSVSLPPNSCPDVPILHNIKVEDTYENEGYGSEMTGHTVKYECEETPIVNNKESPLKGNEDSRCTESDHTRFNVIKSQEAPPCTQALSTHKEVEYRFGARVRQNYRRLVLGKRHGLMAASSKANPKSDTEPHSPAKIEPRQETPEDFTVANKRKRVAINLAAAAKRPFNFMANFPCPPSLIIGNDGDLLPACSLTTTRESQTPHRVHPFWKWQLGGSAVPPPPSHKFRKL